MARAAVAVDESLSRARAPVPAPAHPSYELSTIIQLALKEDAGDRGDVTCLATIPPVTQAEAQFLAKADGVLAGVAVADAVFREVDPTLKVEWSAEDGDLIAKGQHFGTVRGNARSILTAERIALNFMQRMSGIATATRKMAEAAKPARILETRKTAPGLRLIDKWAVLIGGGENHRMGLFDMVMIKDNHIAAAGGIEGAVEGAREYLRENNLDMGVEVETRTLAEVEAVLGCLGEGRGRVTRVMLDNMVTVSPDGGVDTDMLRTAVKLIDGRCETEASGNVTLATVNAIGATGVTFISSGALTHSVTALDISLNIDTELALEVGRRTNTA
ncbi:Quinolinate phosphoribosyl transferase [Klebsormidium nitens]|uniref:Nicotinate-nucleotide pyrophosphorylase [carboxylating] n=1 Tax=Klebsormidium nitens TaxID=105231 RepID=A0A1Y1I4R1_KLENI|nr:Quinolinate phosphoribosyl transferase [Klebsormidium nitens]|eukprot:GAQ83108.1 Quinolinate phosphoribosyl transferase [Klebsormidium nitens]